MRCPYAHVHFVGLGGIHVSALAKLVLSLGISVSGSDLAENELTEELRAKGVDVRIGHAAEHVPANAEVLVFSSAAQITNPERIEGERRHLPSFDSHQFLGLLGKDMKQVVIAGTHGKSTTTAMMGVLFKQLGLKPTVVVGTRVPQLAEGNLEIGSSDWLIAEGDEFDRHFLAYHPTVLVINNIEPDHFDIYPTLEDMRNAYRHLLRQMRSKGIVVINGDDAQIDLVLEDEQRYLDEQAIQVIRVGEGDECDIQILSRRVEAEIQTVNLELSGPQRGVKLMLGVPGEMNARNATMCYAVAHALELSSQEAVNALFSFRGIWRRLEKIGEKNGVLVFSDYGHHPTAVTKTLKAVKEFCPNRRIVLCFQPHHRNRTKHLFQEFVSCFGLADVLVLVEIYDVKGRDQAEDEAVSSKDLIAAMDRPVVYAATPADALSELRGLLAPGDVLLIMGAGDIYKIAYDLV